MFDTVKTGQRIVEFRKRKNLTQAELADMMNVSYQAISNWERGNSMPDISKLPDLAVAFECTIEALLGSSEKTDLISDILNANTEEVKEKMTVERLSELAPILKPDQTTAFLDNLVDQLKAKEVKEWIALAPFISQEKLDELVNGFKTEEKIKDILILAPFLSDQALKKISDHFFESKQFKMVTMLAPFLEEDHLNEMMGICFENGTIHEVVSLYPFISKTKLQELATKIIETEGPKGIIRMAPFL